MTETNRSLRLEVMSLRAIINSKPEKGAGPADGFAAGAVA